MKNLTSFVATLFASTCFSLLQAQTIGDDLTSSLANPSFEEEFVSTIKNGRTFVPNGWTLQKVSDGWNDFRVVTNGEVASDGKNSYFDSYAGNQHVSYWGEKITSLDLYQEVATLPVGGYQLSAMVRLVTHQSALTEPAQKITNQHLYAKILEGDSTVSPIIPVSAVGDTPENWTKLNVLFNIKEEGQIVRLGIASTNDGTNDAGGFQIDDCHLTYVGNGDAFIAQMLAALQQYKELAENIYNDGEPTSGILEELERVIQQATDAESTTDSATLETAVLDLKKVYQDATKSVELRNTLDAAIQKATDDKALNYPGLTALTDAINLAMDIVNSNVDYLVYNEDLEKAIEDLTDASRKYQLSSLEGASESDPKDATWIISCPNFTDGNNALSMGDWICENNPATSKEYKVATINGQNCWNSWSNNFTSMNLYQELTDLPAGKYSLSCETATDGVPHDQHAYLTSSSGTAVSAVPTDYYQGTSFNTEAPWSPLETGKIFVGNDGKLRIGMRSTSGGDTSGWFCATNFTLKYYGITASDYAEAFENRIKEVESYKDSSMLKGDKALIAATVIQAKTTDKNSTEAMDAAFTELNASANIAAKSMAAYGSYMNGEHATSMQYLQENDTTVTQTASKEFLKKITDQQELIVNNDTTHYTIMATIIDQLDAYNNYIQSYDFIVRYKTKEIALANGILESQDQVNLYATKAVVDSLNKDLKALVSALQAYDKQVASAKEYMLHTDEYTAEGINAMKAVLAEQENTVKTAGNTDEINAAAQAVLIGIRSLQLAQKVEGPKDITAWINNPTINQDKGNIKSKPNGWEDSWNSGTNGNFTKLSSGDTYLEIWNSNTSTIKFDYNQTIRDLPAGYYRLTASARTSQGVADGNVVLYAISNKGEYQTKVYNAPYLEGDTENSNDSEDFNTYTVDSVLVTWNTMQIGIKTIDVINTKWTAADNFQLFFLKEIDATAIDNVETDNSSSSLIAYDQNGYIIVENEKEYSITTLTGETMPSDQQLVPGIYIIKAGDRTTKVVVK